MLVRDFMTDGICSAGADSPIEHIAYLMKKNNIGAVAVTDDRGKILGIITDRDLVLRAIAGKGKTAGDIMTKDPVCINPDTDVYTAAALFSRYKVRRLPVLCDEQASGFFSLCDIAKYEAFAHKTGDILHAISTV